MVLVRASTAAMQPRVQGRTFTSPQCHAQTHMATARRPSAGSTASCHEPRIPSICKRRRSICPGASSTVCQRSRLGYQAMRFTLDTPCADLCFRLRIHLLSLTSRPRRSSPQISGFSKRWIRDVQARPAEILWSVEAPHWTSFQEA